MNRQDVIREIDERFRQSGRSLNEVQRRHWAAAEAIKLGRGGITIVSQALRISPTTVRKGIQEIATGQPDAHANTRIRKPGGGRKSKQTLSDQSVEPRSTANDPDGHEHELQTVACLDTNLYPASSIPSDQQSAPVNDNESDQRPS